MREIQPEEAKERHGISVHHSQMANGEFRFRLLKCDGTAYVRTEAVLGGGWQRSHYHTTARETYIVQRAWVACATLVNGRRCISIYRTGEQFTVEPGVVHNLYLAKHAVIHTVKHGDVQGPDRVTNSKADQLNSDTLGLTESEIFSVATVPNERTETYSAEYRHFDTMIWQLPAWSTAIFVATGLGTNALRQSETLLQNVTGISVNNFVIGLFVLMFLALLAMSHVLYRFRYHQRGLKRYAATPLWKSAQIYLQLMVTIEAFALGFVAFESLFNIPSECTAFGTAALFLLYFGYREYALRA